MLHHAVLLMLSSLDMKVLRKRGEDVCGILRIGLAQTIDIDHVGEVREMSIPNCYMSNLTFTAASVLDARRNENETYAQQIARLLNEFFGTHMSVLPLTEIMADFEIIPAPLTIGEIIPHVVRYQETIGKVDTYMEAATYGSLILLRRTTEDHAAELRHYPKSIPFH